MDAEAIVWLVFIGIWFIGGILKQIKQVKEQRPGQPGTEHRAPRETNRPAPQAEDDDPMIQLLRQLGGQVETRPQKPPPPPRPAPPKAVPMAQQVRLAREARAEAASTKAAKKAAISGRKLQSMAAAAARPRVRGGVLARDVRRQLRNPQSARRAILLQEILGKPPGLEGAPARR
jgi:hypothetical protein